MFSWQNATGSVGLMGLPLPRMFSVWAHRISMGEMAVRGAFPIMHQETNSFFSSLPGRNRFSVSSKVSWQSHWPNIRHRVKRSVLGSPITQVQASHWSSPPSLTWQYLFYPFNSYLPHVSTQVRSYPAALWPWSRWCGHLRWGNPKRNRISLRKFILDIYLYFKI